MTVSELMTSAGITPSAAFEGVSLADDYVLAISTTGHSESPAPLSFEVVQSGLKSNAGQLNPEEKTNAYIRTGKSTTKTGTQRTFNLDMDRFLGDTAQEYFDSVKYGTGQECITDYVFFNMLTGKGEQGQVSVIVDTDCGGNPGENSTLSVSLKSTGVKPTSYTYTASGGGNTGGSST